MKLHTLSAIVPLALVMLASCGPTDTATTDPAPAPVAAPADNSALAAQGKGLYPTCAACHGQNAEGMKAMNAPALAHQEPWYLERQLNNFRADFRGAHPNDTYGAQMAPMSKTLANEEAVKAVVAYIKTLPGNGMRPVATITGNIDKGKDYYNMICNACHGPGATGNEALNSPMLIGSDDWYMVRQIDNFRKDMRGLHPKDIYGGQMHTIAKAIPDDQTVLDVTAYINSLGQK
ncbi:MAG: c-type cytochrome [Flavobacteriales bacterium]|nr:c-type cytochrome [Flavobacteriales bacterium]